MVPEETEEDKKKGEEEEESECPTCKGEGKVKQEGEDGVEEEQECSPCKGTGKLKRPPSRRAWEGQEDAAKADKEKKEKTKKTKQEPRPIDPEAGAPLSYDPNFKGPKGEEEREEGDRTWVALFCCYLLLMVAIFIISVLNGQYGKLIYGKANIGNSTTVQAIAVIYLDLVLDPSRAVSLPV